MKSNRANTKFWNSGNGRDFIDWAGKDVPTASHDPELFYQYDKETDILVDNWQKNGDFKKIMKSLYAGTNENLPQDYRDYKNKLETKPSWVDEDLIKHGAELSERSGLMGLLVLRNFAL